MDSKQYFQCQCFTQEELCFIAVSCVPRTPATAEPLLAQLSSFKPFLHYFFASEPVRIASKSQTCDRSIIYENLLAVAGAFRNTGWISLKCVEMMIEKHKSKLRGWHCLLAWCKLCTSV